MYISCCLCQFHSRWVAKAVHKNNSVSGEAAGWLKKVRLETFFPIFSKFCFLKKMDNTFLPTNKKKCGRPTGFNFTHPVDRKQTFFYGQPNANTFSGGKWALMKKKKRKSNTYPSALWPAPAPRGPPAPPWFSVCGLWRPS